MSDLISRQEAIDVLEEQLDYLQTLDKDENPTAESKWYGVNWARNTIADLPSAEPKKGKWVPFEYGDDTWHKCTACGVADNYISVVKRPNGTTGRLESVRNYCPNCGADMRGEE